MTAPTSPLQGIRINIPQTPHSTQLHTSSSNTLSQQFQHTLMNTLKRHAILSSVNNQSHTSHSMNNSAQATPPIFIPGFSRLAQPAIQSAPSAHPPSTPTGKSPSKRDRKNTRKSSLK